MSLWRCRDCRALQVFRKSCFFCEGPLEFTTVDPQSAEEKERDTLEMWRTAALVKDRTRRVIRERITAGENQMDIADDFKVPLAFVSHLAQWQLFGFEEPAALPEPEAAPPHENPPCMGCGGPHPFDTTVPSVRWNAVIRKAGLPDYLCLTCIVSAFVKAGESFTAELVGREHPFEPIEIRTRSQNAIDATAIGAENTTLRAKIRELELAASSSQRPDSTT